ncbi:MAG: hypothetical protein JWP02_160 [Acidimicrobiales bacterium]|jgi:hypothetical protein|nr:hypothetical protein [Acidimicrobiales bacterium]
MRRTLFFALTGSLGSFFAALCAPAFAEAWRRRSGHQDEAPCADPVCDWCAQVTEVVWPDEDETDYSPGRGPYVLATALALTAEGTLESAALAALLAEAHGSVRVLRSAYGSGLALASELPEDRPLHDTLDLLTKALRTAASQPTGVPASRMATNAGFGL